MRSFLGFGQIPYIGIPQPQPIMLSGIAGKIIPLLFQWLSYGASTTKPNINIYVSLQNALCKSFDQIRSVYIDNLGSDNPVYVNFPDTNYTVVAAPNSEGWYPAFTNAKNLSVIGEGFFTGDIPQTFILLSNIPLPPSVNVEINQATALWRASPVITRGTSIYNSSLGIPALGDQLQNSHSADLSINGNTVALWGTPYASGFIYLTNLQLNVINLQNAAVASITLVVESTGVAGILIAPAFTCPGGGGGGSVSLANLLVMNLSGLQTKLDATQTWRLRVQGNITVGQAFAVSSFTQQP